MLTKDSIGLATWHDSEERMSGVPDSSVACPDRETRLDKGQHSTRAARRSNLPEVLARDAERALQHGATVHAYKHPMPSARGLTKPALTCFINSSTP